MKVKYIKNRITKEFIEFEDLEELFQIIKISNRIK